MEGLLTPVEEVALTTIKNHWDKNEVKLSITAIDGELKKRGFSQSPEKTRLIVESLWRKGEVLIDVQGRERMVRPNHVTINSKTEPISIRNFTVMDEKTGTPVQRIWASVYAKGKERYFSLSESRWNGSWKTTSNIIIPPNALKEFKTLIQFIEENTE